MMRAVSLFSGVGGFELGLQRAGIETVLQAESDPWCRAILARHWPNVERVEDVRDISGRAVWDGRGSSWQRKSRPELDGPVDLVYGGFPCQDLSVAGKRAGLGGERSGLWFEFLGVLFQLRPRWALIENVPGLLSSDRGLDFAVLLRGLVERGFGGVGWAVLDAQHFGIPQRRRRVFIVAGPSERACQAVLAICESCAGNPPPRRETRQGLAYSLAASARGPGDGHGNAWNSTYIPSDYSTGGYRESEQSGALPGVTDGSRLPLVARSQTASNERLDGESDNFMVGKTVLRGGHGNNPLDENLIVASSIRASDGHHGHSSPRGDGADNLIPIDLRQTSRGATMTNNRAHGSGGAPGTGVGNAGDSAFTVSSREQAVSGAMGVRRLTPLECERLQGWPDNHTKYTADGREVSDSIRYRMIGNGVASPCAEWLGHRLIAVEEVAS